MKADKRYAEKRLFPVKHSLKIWIGVSRVVFERPSRSFPIAQELNIKGYVLWGQKPQTDQTATDA